MDIYFSYKNSYAKGFQDDRDTKTKQNNNDNSLEFKNLHNHLFF